MTQIAAVKIARDCYAALSMEDWHNYATHRIAGGPWMALIFFEVPNQKRS